MEIDIKKIVNDIINKLVWVDGEVELTLDQLKEISSPLYKINYSKVKPDNQYVPSHFYFIEECPQLFYDFLSDNELTEEYLRVYKKEYSDSINEQGLQKSLKNFFKITNVNSYINSLCTWDNYPDTDWWQYHDLWNKILKRKAPFIRQDIEVNPVPF